MKKQAEDSTSKRLCEWLYSAIFTQVSTCTPYLNDDWKSMLTLLYNKTRLFGRFLTKLHEMGCLRCYLLCLNLLRFDNPVIEKSDWFTNDCIVLSLQFDLCSACSHNMDNHLALFIKFRIGSLLIAKFKKCQLLTYNKLFLFHKSSPVSLFHIIMYLRQKAILCFKLIHLFCHLNIICRKTIAIMCCKCHLHTIIHIEPFWMMIHLWNW